MTTNIEVRTPAAHDHEALYAAPTRSAAPRRRVLRSAVAVLAGFLTTAVLSSAADVALHGTGDYARLSDGLFAIALTYRVIFAVAGCYLAARLAPSRPLRHALVLGAVGTVLSLGGAIAMWNTGPAWYSLGVMATALPCAWAAGRLREKQLAR